MSFWQMFWITLSSPKVRFHLGWDVPKPHFLNGLLVPYQSTLSFPHSSAGKESVCNAGDLGSVPGLGRSPGEGERLPTLVFWPGEFHGLLHSTWGRKESDPTEWFHFLSNTNSILLFHSHKLILFNNSRASTGCRWAAHMGPRLWDTEGREGLCDGWSLRTWESAFISTAAAATDRHLLDISHVLGTSLTSSTLSGRVFFCFHFLELNSWNRQVKTHRI